MTQGSRGTASSCWRGFTKAAHTKCVAIFRLEATTLIRARNRRGRITQTGSRPHGNEVKDRVVPIGTSALDWIEKYVQDVRPDYTGPHAGSRLFLGLHHRPISRYHLAQFVRAAIDAAGIQKTGACHLLRHTAATHTLERGAYLRSLQVFLGHEKLDATQNYTHLTLGRLQQVHQQTHLTGDGRKPSTDAPSSMRDDDDDPEAMALGRK